MKGIYAYRPLDPTSHPLDAAERAPDMLATWLRWFPDSQPQKRDSEDWVENAVLLHEADRLGLDLNILGPAGQVHISGSGWSCPIAKPGAPAGALLGYWGNRDFLEPIPLDMDPVGSDARAVRVAGGYASSPVFLRHAGRAIALAHGDVGGERGLEAALRSVVDATGSGEIFIKTVNKEWSGRFVVDPASDKRLWDQLCRADDAREDETGNSYGLSWIPVQHEGSTNPVLMIQGRIAPTYEYRIFVIDGRPVTGSGCIELFTPAENSGETFDPQMERIRSDGDVVVETNLRDRYLAFAEAFCAEFAAEHGEGLDYSLDLCVDEMTGKIRAIELNPPLNLGKYACDIGAWIKATVERTERIAEARA